MTEELSMARYLYMLMLGDEGSYRGCYQAQDESASLLWLWGHLQRVLRG